jgi:hypothetical protein
MDPFTLIGLGVLAAASATASSQRRSGALQMAQVTRAIGVGEALEVSEAAPTGRTLWEALEVWQVPVKLTMSKEWIPTLEHRMDRVLYRLFSSGIAWNDGWKHVDDRRLPDRAKLWPLIRGAFTGQLPPLHIDWIGSGPETRVVGTLDVLSGRLIAQGSVLGPDLLEVASQVAEGDLVEDVYEALAEAFPIDSSPEYEDSSNLEATTFDIEVQASTLPKAMEELERQLREARRQADATMKDYRFRRDKIIADCVRELSGA